MLATSATVFCSLLEQCKIGMIKNYKMYFFRKYQIKWLVEYI